MKTIIKKAIPIILVYFTFNELLLVSIILYKSNPNIIAIYALLFIFSIYTLRVMTKFTTLNIVTLLVTTYFLIVFINMQKSQGLDSTYVRYSSLQTKLTSLRPKVREYIKHNNSCPKEIKNLKLASRFYIDPFAADGSYMHIVQTANGCVIKSVGVNKELDSDYYNVLDNEMPHFGKGSFWSLVYSKSIIFYFAPSLTNHQLDLGIRIEIP